VTGLHIVPGNGFQRLVMETTAASGISFAQFGWASGAAVSFYGAKRSKRYKRIARAAGDAIN